MVDLGKLSELAHHRVCGVCGAEFESIPATRDSPEVPALQQFSDHTIVHNPKPEEWAAAYKKIEAGRELRKSS